MHRKTFEAGEVIFREGDDSNEAYWILTGKVEISIETPQGRSILTTLDEGEIFGEMGMVDDQPRAASARALGRTEVEVINEADFQDEVLRKEARLFPYIATLFERLRMTTALLESEMAKGRGTGAARGGGAEALAARPVPSSGTTVPATVVLESTERSAALHPEGLRVEVTKFPFRIGRKSDHEGASAFFRVDLSLDDRRPYSVSRGHCMIECKGGKYFVRDCASRLGTTVNGQLLGGGESEIVAELRPGANTLVLGLEEGPQHYVVNVG